MCYGGLDAKNLMRDADARLAGLPARSLADAEGIDAKPGVWQRVKAFLRLRAASRVTVAE
jgi:hypothetical protein